MLDGAKVIDVQIVISHGGGAPRRLLADGDLPDATATVPQFVTPSDEAPGGQVGIALGPAVERPRPGQQNGERRENLFVDTCCYDPHVLTAVLRQGGTARVVFGTEAPGSGSHLVNPVTGRPADDLLATLRGLGFLSAEQLRPIVHDNPLRAFPLLAKALS
jgi:hypothetical protein